ANSAGRVRYLSPRWRVNTRATVAPSTSVTTNAPPTCASTKANGRFWSQVAECLNVAPNTSCTRITASASTLNGLNDAFSVLRSGEGGDIQLGEVNTAMLTVMRKNNCARVASAAETASGKSNLTVNPPSSPCAITVANAENANQRIHDLRSRR